MQETWVRSLGQEDPLQKGMATLSRILAWRIPRTEGPGGTAGHGVTCQSCHNAGLPGERPVKQKYIFSQLWSLEVSGQGVGRAAVFAGLSPWCVDGHLPASSAGLSSACLCPHLLCLLVLLDEGPPLLPCFHVITSLKTLSPNTVKF